MCKDVIPISIRNNLTMKKKIGKAALLIIVECFITKEEDAFYFKYKKLLAIHLEIYTSNLKNPEITSRLIAVCDKYGYII